MNLHQSEASLRLVGRREGSVLGGCLYMGMSLFICLFVRFAIPALATKKQFVYLKKLGPGETQPRNNDLMMCYLLFVLNKQGEVEGSSVADANQ